MMFKTFEQAMACHTTRKWFIPYLRHQVLEGLHDLGTFCFLVIREAASNDNHSSQHNTQVQLQKAEKVSQRTICLKGFQFVQINCLAFKCPITSMKVLAVSVHFEHKSCPHLVLLKHNTKEVACSFHYVEALQNMLSSHTEFPMLMGKASGLNA